MFAGYTANTFSLKVRKNGNALYGNALFRTTTTIIAAVSA
jgi:hypothetical protein